MVLAIKTCPLPTFLTASLQHHPPPSTLRPPPFILHPPPSTLHHPPFTLRHPPSTLHSSPSILHPPPYTHHPPPVVRPALWYSRCRTYREQRGGLVFQAHKLLSQSSLGSRVIKKKKKRNKVNFLICIIEAKTRFWPKLSYLCQFARQR